MKNGRKKAILIGIILALLVCVPVPLQRKDGGTKEYVAVLYRVIVWHRFNPDYRDSETDSIRPNEPEYLTGTNVYLFPSNFADIEWKSNKAK